MRSGSISGKLPGLLTEHRRAIFVVLVAALWCCGRDPVCAQTYRDSQAPIPQRVQDLLARMTPEEKFWQLFMVGGDWQGDVGRYTHGLCAFQAPVEIDSATWAIRADEIQRHFVENTRLGIPVIICAEALHGLVQSGATVFPQAIGLAATFDTTLMREVSGAIALECRSRGIRQVLSPVVNIASDVRWGRTEETYGEDPFLTAAMGVAFVAEFERLGIVTTPKHFIANVGDGGRDSYPIHLNERLIREVHLPPFEACLRRGGARSVMTSYNSYDGSPCSASEWLNTRLLKEELGFTGFIISDAGAVGGANVLHFTASDYADAGAKAITAGLDVVFQTAYEHHTLFMPPFLDGRVSEAIIDSAVARVLRVKFELGLFEEPYLTTGWANSLDGSAHRRLARRAAQESMVLLQNREGTLPLDRSVRSLAVIGPDAAEVRYGGYSAPVTRPFSILDGIKEKLGTSVEVGHAIGCRRLSPQFVSVPPSCLSHIELDSAGPGLLGHYFNNITLSGDPAVIRTDPAVQFQWTLFSPDPERLPYDFYSVRWTGLLTSPESGRFRIGLEGNDGYRLFIDDSLVIDNWTKASFRTLTREVMFEAGRAYRLRLEYFEPTGNARIRLVWNLGGDDEESTIREAVALAAASDAVVIAVGLEEGEFRDRASLALPGRQEELIERVAALGKPTVVVLVGGSAVTMSRWIDRVGAVLDVWYPGEQGGRAVADVLFGDYDPAGRLPVTFPVAEGQLPLVYNHKPTGRGDDYYDLTGQPLFPFGHGLSYTSFGYDSLKLSPPVIKTGGETTVRFTLTNLGSREGDEVVQLYVRDELASVARPVSELKGFQRVHLRPGETRALSFRIGPRELSMLNAELRTVVEPGTFRIMIGASSKDIRLRGILTVTE